MMTEYPWQGNIKLQIMKSGKSPWVLSLRIPEWSHDPVLSVNGKVIRELRLEKGYLVLEGTWQVGDVIELELRMEAILVASNPRIDATRGCFAIQRGPIIYCLEDKDQEIKGRLLDVEIDKDGPLSTRWDGDLLEGVIVVEASGQLVDSGSWRGHLYQPAVSPVQAIHHPIRLVAIPYYAWANRVIGGMRVWIPYRLS